MKSSALWDCRVVGLFSIRTCSPTEWAHIAGGEEKVRGGVSVSTDNGSPGLHVSVAALLKSNMAASHFTLTHTGDYLNNAAHNCCYFFFFLSSLRVKKIHFACLWLFCICCNLQKAVEQKKIQQWDRHFIYILEILKLRTERTCEKTKQEQIQETSSSIWQLRSI